MVAIIFCTATLCLPKFLKLSKQQFIVIASAFTLLLALLIFGKTVNPNKPTQPVVDAAQQINFTEQLANIKQALKPYQQNKLAVLELQLNAEKTSDKLTALNSLSNYWKDSIGIKEPYLFYLAEAAKLDNSEKTLTFAAQQITDNLLTVAEPALQHWLATNAKVLFDKALVINPNNDSSKIGLGACYILGDISNNPMQGILPVREIANKNPHNLYAQLILGLGGRKSGQFDKAIERFSIINQHQPNNTEIVLQLAECYELKGDKLNAVKWYEKGKNLITNADIKTEIDKRIKQISKH